MVCFIKKQNNILHEKIAFALVFKTLKLSTNFGNIISILSIHEIT